MGASSCTAFSKWASLSLRLAEPPCVPSRRSPKWRIRLVIYAGIALSCNCLPPVKNQKVQFSVVSPLPCLDLTSAPPGPLGHESRWSSLVAAPDHRNCRGGDGALVTARQQDLFPAHPGGLAPQYLAQFPSPVEHSGLHSGDRDPHDPSSLFC
jgi:hypothetical protein